MSFTGTLEVHCSWREVEKPWLNCTLHLLTWTDKQWSGVCQDPSCPELESQVIAKFLIGSSILPGCLESRKTPSSIPPWFNGTLKAWCSPFCPISQISSPNKSRDMDKLSCCFSPVCFSTQMVSGEVKTHLWVPSLGKNKGDHRSCIEQVFVWSACQQNGKKCWWELLLSIQGLRTISLALEFLVPRAVPEPGPRDEGTCKARAVERAGSTWTTRSKIPGRCPCHHGRVVGVAAVSGYVYV